MDIWILTDPHFEHEMLVEESLRPKGFSERIMKNLQQRLVKPDSVLVVLGDLCWCNDAGWCARLNELPCRKWLVLGNHDGKSVSWYMGHGFDMVCESFSLTLFGKRLLFSHMPVPNEGYDLNIHGHFHDFSLEKVKEVEPEIYGILNDRHYLVSLEKLGYEPVKLKRIIDETNERAVGQARGDARVPAPEHQEEPPVP